MITQSSIDPDPTQNQIIPFEEKIEEKQSTKLIRADAKKLGEQIESVNMLGIAFQEMNEFQKLKKNMIDQISQIIGLTPKIKKVKQENENTIEYFDEYVKLLGDLKIEMIDLEEINTYLKSLSLKVSDYQIEVLKKISWKLESGDYCFNKNILRTLSLEKELLNEKLTKLKNRISEKQELLKKFQLKYKIQEIEGKIRLIQQEKLTETELKNLEKYQRDISQKEQELTTINEKKRLRQLKTRILNNQIDGFKQKITDLQNKIKDLEPSKKNDLEKIEKLKGNKQKQQEEQKLILQGRIKMLKDEEKDLQIKYQNSKNEIIILQTQQKDNFTSQILELFIEKRNFYRIIILDESGSMSGEPFNSAIKGIKNIFSNLQQDFDCEDTCCLIQFNDKARIVLQKQKIKKIDLTQFPHQINGGGTNFEVAFKMLDKVLDNCDITERPQVLFLTDGDCDSKYLAVLEEIKKKHQSKEISLFCLGYGDDVKFKNLEACLQVINQSKTTISLRNGSKISTLYKVSQPNEIIEALQKINQNSQASLFSLNSQKKEIQSLNDEHLKNISNHYDKSILLKKQELEYEEKKLNELSTDNYKFCLEDEYADIELKYKKKLTDFEADITQQRNLIRDVEVKKNVLQSEEEQIDSQIKLCNQQIDNIKNSDNSLQKKETQEKRKQDLIESLSENGFLSLEKYENFKNSYQKPLQMVDEVIKYYTSAGLCLQKQEYQIKNLEDGINDYLETQSKLKTPKPSEITERFALIFGINSDIQSEKVGEAIIKQSNPNLINEILSQKENQNYFNSQHKHYLTQTLISHLMLNLHEVQNLNVCQEKIEKDINQNDILKKFQTKISDYSRKLLKEKFYVDSQGGKDDGCSKLNAKLQKINDDKNKFVEGKKIKLKKYEDQVKNDVQKLRKQLDKDLKEATQDEYENLREQSEIEINQKEADLQEYQNEVEQELSESNEEYDVKIQQIQKEIKTLKNTIQNKKDQQFFSNYSTTFKYIEMIVTIFKLSIDDMNYQYNKYHSQLPLIRMLETCKSGAKLVHENQISIGC